MTIFINATIATLHGSAPYGLIEKAALVIKDGLVAWVGPMENLPDIYRKDQKTDLKNRVISPALIDCHTHIVHAGNRANEFEMRQKGASYADVARAGGGIVSTVLATRKASIEQLVLSALPRVDALIAQGVCVIEVKSGYGLDSETEANMLRAARRIAQLRPVGIVTSFLGAHAVPKEYSGRPDAYIDEVCLPSLRAAHAEGLVDAVDGFCENIGFSPAQIARVFDCAKSLGLPVKLHAEQLSHLGAARLACRYGALSADHLEYATPEDAKEMAQANLVAVLLPGAFYTLGETKLPPMSAFRQHNVAMALATDCNPGSSPMSSLLLAMNMGCTLFGLTPEEALIAVSKNAASALGLNTCGSIKIGNRADLAIWDIMHPAELAYNIGFNPLYLRVFGGVS